MRSSINRNNQRGSHRERVAYFACATNAALWVNKDPSFSPQPAANNTRSAICADSVLWYISCTTRKSSFSRTFWKRFWLIQLHDCQAPTNHCHANPNWLSNEHISCIQYNMDINNSLMQSLPPLLRIKGTSSYSQSTHSRRVVIQCYPLNHHSAYQ